MKQYDIYLVNLDPTLGSEIKKNRPCVIVSPNEMNDHLRTVQIAPMTSTIKNYPWRVTLLLKNKKGAIALDQLRTVDRQRLIKKMGSLKTETIQKVKNIILEMLIK